MRPLHTAVFSLPMWAGTVKETWFQVYEKVHFLSVPEMVSPSFKEQRDLILAEFLEFLPAPDQSQG